MLFLDHVKRHYTNLNNIFEIGAHRGYDIKEIKSIWPEANIHAFEADPFNYNICKTNCKDFANTSIYNLAVYDKDEKLKFNRFCDIEKIPDSQTFVSKNFQFTGCGSIKNPGIGLKEIFNINEVVEQIEVDAVTLNSFCKNNNINSVDAIFMDVQGAEWNVINGCSDFISTTKAIILEWSTKYVLYEDELDFNFIKLYLESIGFNEVEREYQLQGINGDSLFLRLE